MPHTPKWLLWTHILITHSFFFLLEASPLPLLNHLIQEKQPKIIPIATLGFRMGPYTNVSGAGIWTKPVMASDSGLRKSHAWWEKLVQSQLAESGHQGCMWDVLMLLGELQPSYSDFGGDQGCGNRMVAPHNAPIGYCQPSRATECTPRAPACSVEAHYRRLPQGCKWMLRKEGSCPVWN